MQKSQTKRGGMPCETSGIFERFDCQNVVFRCIRYVALPAIIPRGRGEGERFVYSRYGDVGHSVSHDTKYAHLSWKAPYTDNRIQFDRIGNIVICHGNVKFTASGQCNYSTANETLPKGFRPTEANVPVVFSMGGNFALLFDATGKVTMLGNPNSAFACCTGSWYTKDDFPA